MHEYFLKSFNKTKFLKLDSKRLRLLKEFSVGGWWWWVHNEFSVLLFVQSFAFGLGILTKLNNSVSRRYEWCLRFKGCFKDVSRVFQGRFKKLQECFI